MSNNRGRVEIVDEETIKSLLEKDEVKIKKEFEGETALHDAVNNDHENLVSLLCKNKELLFMRDEKGRTPLFIAVSKGHVKIVETLCQNGSRVNDIDTVRNTPLLIAVSQNHPEVVTSLVRHGASLQSDGCILNPFHVAVEKNFKPIVQILLKYANLIDICSCPSYPDPKFAEEIFHHCLEKRFARDYVIGKKHKKCKSALHFAAYYGRIDQVKRLIQFGARVNEEAYGNWRTPLHEAVLGKDFEASLKIMEILMKNGASVHVFDKYAETPLHYAVEEEEFRPEKIRLLLDHKADINANLNGDRTPISFANCGAILQMLIDNGANVNYIRTVFSSLFFFDITMLGFSLPSTPLQEMIVENHSMNVDILLENGAKIYSSTVQFLKKDPKINERVIDGLSDITSVIENLVEDRHDNRNIIPILAKRHFQGEVTINSEEFFSASGIFFSKFKECQEELERMRDISVLHLSLFDILAMPIEKLRSYATKEEVLKVFESGTIEDKFPVYSGMIMRRFKKAKEERDLIDSSSEALKKIVFSFHKIHLPDLVVYEIMDFLHMVDRKKLVAL